MRFLILVFLCFVPVIKMAIAQPIPHKKPIIDALPLNVNDTDNTPSFTIASKPPVKPSQRQKTTFEKVMENALNPAFVNEDAKPDDIIDDIADIAIPIPPPLPVFKQKSTNDITTQQSQIIGGVPIPTIKPFKLVTTQSRFMNERQAKQQKDKMIIQYQGNNDTDRTAGRTPTSSGTNNRERIYANKVGRLRETKEKSPFKTAALPMAANKSLSDPIILFFKEGSTQMEVGQMALLRDNVLKPLKSTIKRSVTINGYANTGTNTDETRRLSLSRALMVREFLIDNRIKASRIDVRALSDNTPIAPKNRVDIMLSR